MAEENAQGSAPQATNPTADQSIRTVVVGACIILWLTAIYMINLMNGISQKLDKIDMNWQSSMSVMNQRPLENYQIVDKDGNIVYVFQVDPKLFEGMEGMGGEMMEGAACPASVPNK